MIRRLATAFRLRLPLPQFVRDRRGVSAVEFSLLAPLMIGIYLSGVEISEGIGIDRKVTIAAGALANLTAQVSTVSDSDMSNIMSAATAIMAPYPAGKLTIVVSCLTIDANGTAKVSWSDAKNTSKRATNSVVSIPSALAVANTSLIFSEVSYSYTPTIGRTITGTLTLADKMYMSPRLSTTVKRT